MAVFCGFSRVLSAPSDVTGGRDWRYFAISRECAAHSHCHTTSAARHILHLILFLVGPLGFKRGIEHGAVAHEAGTGMRRGVDLGELGR